jgi:hypothetical protein
VSDPQGGTERRCGHPSHASVICAAFCGSSRTDLVPRYNNHPTTCLSVFLPSFTTFRLSPQRQQAGAAASAVGAVTGAAVVAVAVVSAADAAAAAAAAAVSAVTVAATGSLPVPAAAVAALPRSTWRTPAPSPAWPRGFRRTSVAPEGFVLHPRAWFSPRVGLRPYLGLTGPCYS